MDTEPPNLHAVANSSSEATPAITAAATVNLANLRHNVRFLQKQAGPAELMAVIKADAYGHGALPITRALRQEGLHRFAVANLPEAVALREAGIDDPVLVFAGPLPEYLPAYAEYDLDVTVSSTGAARIIIEQALPLRAHVKVDTGMSRLGIPPADAAGVVRRLSAAPHVTVAGLWTHFASADEEDLSFTQQQLDRFQRVVDRVGSAAKHAHVANSAGLLALPDQVTDFPAPLIRTGLALYGLAPRPGMPRAEALRPVMQFTSRITHLKTVPAGTPVSYGRTWEADRPTRLATVGAGYADGYRRLLSNRAEVGIAEGRYPVVGNVCMDMFMVDLGPPDTAPDVEVGDDVVLFGQNGPAASEVAAWAETITYEICTGVGPRVPRQYVD